MIGPSRHSNPSLLRTRMDKLREMKPNPRETEFVGGVIITVGVVCLAAALGLMAGQEWGR